MIRSDLLKWARERAGDDLNTAIVKIHKKVPQWEKGEDFPTFKQLEKLADRYKVPVAVFFFLTPQKRKT